MASATINGDTIAVDSASGTVIVERVPHRGHFHTHFDRHFAFHLSNGGRIELSDHMQPLFTGELLLGPTEFTAGSPSGTCIYYTPGGSQLRDSAYRTGQNGGTAGKITLTKSEVLTINAVKYVSISGNAVCQVVAFDTQAELHDFESEAYENLEKASIRLTFQNLPLRFIEQ